MLAKKSTSRTVQWSETKADFEAVFYELEKKGEDTPEGRPVAKLIELLSQLGRWDEITKAEQREVVTGLRALLSRYHWQIMITPTNQGLRSVTVPHREVPPDWGQPIVGRLLTLFSEGAFSRIRRCRVCKVWFYAQGRADQAWCSRPCYRREYSTNPVEKAKHAARMAGYRKREKETEERNKARVGFTTQPRKRGQKRRARTSRGVVK